MNLDSQLGGIKSGCLWQRAACLHTSLLDVRSTQRALVGWLGGWAGRVGAASLVSSQSSRLGKKG